MYDLENYVLLNICNMRIHLLVPVLVILFNDVLGNLLIELGWTGKIIGAYGLVKFGLLFLVIINALVGGMYVKKEMYKWLFQVWGILYSFVILYYSIRLFMNIIGLLPNSFIYNSHASLGLSVFTFGFFYLVNRSSLLLQNK